MEQSQSPAGEAATAKGAGPRQLITIVAALVVGFGLGWQFVGPAFASSGQAEVSEEESGGEHGGAPASSLIFSLDGVIVNPAGSRGRNHLIATVAFKVQNSADEARLRGAEVMLRDAVASLLERKSIDDLTRSGIRDQLRSELAAIAARHLKGGKVEVFLPQFIVQ